MENLIINSNPEMIYYPAVDFNYKTGILEITGESYMEETYQFYGPLITWFTDYIKEKRPVTFNIKLTYFNTSSSRFIIVLLDMLKKYKDGGGDVIVNWYYKKHDPDIISEIKDFMDETGIEIQLLSTD
jgi:hypothetical protein